MSTGYEKTYYRNETVRAIQWTGDNYRNIVEFVGDFVAFSADKRLKIFSPSAKISSLIVPHGRWLIRQDDGSITNLSDVAFRDIYDVPEEDQ